MIYVISDTHFGHANIIKYCDRPFKDVEEMNAELIRRWNETVKPSDTVIHVGDFAMGKRGKEQADIVAQLNGTKIIVVGNHDPSPRKLLDMGFHLAVDSMVMRDSSGARFLFTHHPMDPDKARGQILDDLEIDFHVHGHVHNKTNLFYAERSINVSCENLNFTPQPLDTLVIKYNYDKTAKRV